MSKQEETIVEEEEEEEDETTPAVDETTPAVDETTPTVSETPNLVTEAMAKAGSDELKVVIILKADRAMIGVQAPDCDPVYETMEGDLAAVLAWVPHTVEVARLKWAVSKRNPKADLPKPVTQPAPARTASATTSRKPATTKAATAQPKFF